jgi:hypothetical protein
MPSAIELSVLLGLPVRKVEEFCKVISFDLDEPDFEADKEFETVARSVKRKRASSYALAFVVEYATNEQRQFVLDLDPEFAAEYVSLGLPIVSAEYLDGAQEILEALSKEGATDSRPQAFSLADWLRRTIRAAGRPVGHSYIAVRLLLSLPAAEMRAYPQIIASVLNRLRHRGFLDGWFDVQSIDGKNSVIYHNPEAAPTFPWLTAGRVQAAAKLLGSTDPINLAGYLAMAEASEFEAVKAALLAKPELIFAAPVLDL